MQELLDSLRASLIGVAETIVAFLPNLLAAIVLLIVGWILGKLIGALVTRILRAAKFNDVAARADVDTFLERAGMRAGPSVVVGSLVRWIIYLMFFLAAFSALGLPQLATLINSVIAYLPRVVLAVVILLVGALVGKVAAGLIRGTLSSMGIGGADIFGNVARFAIIAFVAIAALDILEIAPNVVNALWIAFLTLVVGSLVLAFGLGGRQSANSLLTGRLLRSELEPGVEIETPEGKGKVLTIGSLFTTLESGDSVFKVPNSELTVQHLRMDQGQYRWQQEKRQEIKERAQRAAQDQQMQREERPQTASKRAA